MRRNLIKNLFFTIDQLVSSTQIIFSRASLSQKLQQLDILEGVDNRYLNRSLKRFKEQNLVKIINRKGQIYYCLTDKGVKKLANFRLKNTGRIGGQKWDGFWRVVIFDIPEDKKIVREALRRRLKYFGFFPLQKSVFAFPFSCENEIEDLANFFQIGECLQTLLVKSLGQKEEEVRQFFQSIL